MYQDVLTKLATVGAPPDDFNAPGQNWGFPPMIPDKLRESGNDMFIQTIRKNMRHMGALRIDHALGLFRLFWIPKGMHPRDGAYVRCNAEDFLRIIALESVRNRTLVIGEDLGTRTDLQQVYRAGLSFCFAIRDTLPLQAACLTISRGSLHPEPVLMASRVILNPKQNLSLGPRARTTSF